MPKRRLYHEDLYKKGNASTSLVVEGRVVDPGMIRYITAGAIEDQTTAPSTLSFGKLVGDRFIVMEEEDTPSLGITFSLNRTHHFIAGEKPAFRVESGGSSDVMRGYLEGYEEEAA